MIGLKRLLKNGHFTYNLNGMDTKMEMMRSGSSIAMFTSNCLVHEQDSEMTKEDMYDHYVKF